MKSIHGITFESGKDLFTKNCIVCHLGGNNIIIPEKNLKKESLDENGMNNLNAISYQILNGKNGMPAFSGRLTEPEIESIAKYVLEQSATNFYRETP
jgi:cytochrome c6